MRNLATSLLAAIILFKYTAAQDDDKNISIQQAVEEYRFIKGNKQNPVQVKETQETGYFCNEYRTNIAIAEFYDAQVEINDVDIWVNGDRDKRFSPSYDAYTIDGIF